MGGNCRSKRQRRSRSPQHPSPSDRPLSNSAPPDQAPSFARSRAGGGSPGWSLHRDGKSGVVGQRRRREGSRAADQIDVRSGRRGQPACDRLAGMTKSPAAAALDSIVADVLAPDLKSMGFRKKSRHWSHEAGETYRGVTVQSSQFNVTSDSRFTVEIGASFVALGHPVPNAPGAWGTAVSRRLSGLRSEPIDEWFAFDARDEATIERAGADLGRMWAQLGRPFLTALQSPQALCDFVCDTGSAELALEVLDRVAVPLG